MLLEVDPARASKAAPPTSVALATAIEAMTIPTPRRVWGDLRMRTAATVASSKEMTDGTNAKNSGTEMTATTRPATASGSAR